MENFSFKKNWNNFKTLIDILQNQFFIGSIKICTSFLVLCNSVVSDADCGEERTCFDGKIETENWDESIWNAFTGCFALSKIQGRDKIELIFHTYRTFKIMKFPNEIFFG